MLVYGIEVPLVEIIFSLTIVIFVLMIESIILILLLIKQLNKTKQLSQLTEKLSETILSVKKAEIHELDKLKIKRKK